MKRFIVSLLLTTLMMTSFVGCSSSNKETSANNESSKSKQSEEKKNIDLEKLVVYFVPSREPEEIIAATDPLKGLLLEELTKSGYNVGEIVIEVGTSYEAVGEALGAGTAHVGFIPGGTYVLYKDSAEVILTATRAGLNKNSQNSKDWNDGKSTEVTDEQVTYYKALIVAGPSEKGQKLSKKINSGEKLTAEDVKGVNWGVRSSSSSAGYIYPTIWLRDNFGISITDLPNVVQTDSYGSTMARLSSGQIDVATFYADARRDYSDKWTSEYGRKASIWEETSVIGVTPDIYNDTISVSKNSDIMDEKLTEALKEAFINISKTEEGKKVISVYSHEGYKKASEKDYDKELEAQKILKSLK